MPVRRALGVRTVFNLLGPLTNPAGARRQLLGVYARDKVEALARVLLELGAEHALVVHGADGLDEITTTGATLVAEVREGVLTTYELLPEDLGVERAPLEALVGGAPEENAARMAELLEGGGEPALAAVTALNAGAALYVAGRARSLREGVEAARALLAAGAAARKLAELRSYR
jgi:anthranilate phosphoribosyltransferase